MAKGSPRWRFLHLPQTMSGILGTPVIVRQEIAGTQKPRFMLLRPYLVFILGARLSFGSVVGCAAFIFPAS
jgi:hypothetical protein